MIKPNANVVRHQSQLASQATNQARQTLLGQRPLTLWLTGLSASGKSTLAFALEQQLLALGRACFVLDGDNVRHGLNSNLGFSAEDRTENIRRIAEVAKMMNQAGLIVITAFISPYQADRANARAIIGTNRFKEVYVSTPLNICESRDPKGLYSKARAGVLPAFTGITAPYEPPSAPDLHVDTSQTSVADSLASLMALVLAHV